MLGGCPKRPKKGDPIIKVCVGLRYVRMDMGRLSPNWPPAIGEGSFQLVSVFVSASVRARAFVLASAHMRTCVRVRVRVRVHVRSLGSSAPRRLERIILLVQPPLPAYITLYHLISPSSLHMSPLCLHISPVCLHISPFCPHALAHIRAHARACMRACVHACVIAWACSYMHA